MNSNTNAGAYNMNDLPSDRRSVIRTIAAAVCLGAVVGAIGIPMVLDIVADYKHRYAQSLIAEEIRKTDIDPDNKNPRLVAIKLAQCQGQRDDLINRLGIVAANIDLSDL